MLYSAAALSAACCLNLSRYGWRKSRSAGGSRVLNHSFSEAAAQLRLLCTLHTQCPFPSPALRECCNFYSFIEPMEHNQYVVVREHLSKKKKCFLLGIAQKGVGGGPWPNFLYRFFTSP